MKLNSFADILFHELHTPAAFFRPDGLLLRVNDDFAALAGYPKSCLENVYRINQFIPPDQVQQLLASIDSLRVESQKELNHMRKIIFCDSKNKETHVRASVVSVPRHKELLIILRDDPFTDVHGDEETQQQFRRFFEQNETAILFFELSSGMIVDANAAASKLFGYSKEELLAGGVELFAEPNELENLRRILRCIASPDTSYVMSYLKRDGSRSLLRFYINRARINGNDLISCSFQDIGDEIRLKQELRFRQAQLVDANKMRALGMLVSSVAHEISNPNNFIMHNIQIIADVCKDILPILRDYHQEHGDYYIGGIPLSEFEDVLPRLVYGVREGSVRISNMVTHLREYVRNDHAGLDKSVDLSEVVVNAIALMQSEITRYTTSFQMMCAEQLPRISGNAQKLEQVIINLLMNALQSLPDKDHSVSVLVMHDTDTDEVLLVVKDEGIGMDELVMTKIFEPFFSTKWQRGGTGLGLYISHAIIREHKGEIVFTSAPGEGTTVTVRIPALGSNAGVS